MVVNTLLDPRLLLEAVMQLTPGKNPLLWVIINAFVVMYSLYLLLLVANYAADDTRKALRLADQSYLVYDFSTTIIWVVETFLGVATIVGEGRKECWKFSIPASMLHVLVSLFFLWDSYATLDKWKWRQEDIIVDMFWVIMNLMAYLVVLAETTYHFVQLRRRRHQYSQLDNHEHNGHDDTNNDIIYHDALLARVLPYYERAQRRAENRPVKPLRTEDFTKLLTTMGDELVVLVPAL
ncbi:expressed unknown protein [Seminavis robusta]|uniref:Uncharacterized protein n=1 Tax=Seminavis robusta TaxID=568900 RepID=A0A9N8EHR0_9STRA|nr:expressed unknown protein [Seminavis robusta]|eukprot:Sro1152_g246870.1 n/a (237) ;mRNA; f:13653-14363